MSGTLRRVSSGLLLVILLTPIAAAAQPCLQVGDQAATVFNVVVDVPMKFALTRAGKDALDQLGLRLAYLEIGQVGIPDQRSFRRLLAGDDRTAEFSFGRTGTYELSVKGAKEFAWPLLDGGSPRPLPCLNQRVVVEESKMPPREFRGVRAQWWAGYRPLVQGALGASAFYRRYGVAMSVESKLPKPRREGDPPHLNVVTVASEFRVRGARGYLGGGVRFFPDAEPDRHRVRITAVAGEELPSFKGRPIWLVADVRLERAQWPWNKSFWKDLAFSAGVRFDLPGSTQP